VDDENSHVIIEPSEQIRRVSSALQDRSAIVVCKGSFNPIHDGHVELLRAARRAYPSALGVFGLSFHTNKAKLSEEEISRRMGYVHQAGFAVLLSSTGYFFENVEYLARWVPGVQVVFACGTDVLMRLYKYFDDLEDDFETRLGTAKFVCVRRRGDAQIVEELTRRLPAQQVEIIDLDGKYADLSSTRIRQFVQDGRTKDIRELMPRHSADAYLADARVVKGRQD
jgi:nicotinic acid mononucleotide adenylyltransferase